MESLPTPGTGINGGSIAKWPPWGRGRRAASCNSVDQENEGTYIPLSDLRSTESINADTKAFPLVSPHPRTIAAGDAAPAVQVDLTVINGGAEGKPSTPCSTPPTPTPALGEAHDISFEPRCDGREGGILYSPPSSPASSTSSSSMNHIFTSATTIPMSLMPQSPRVLQHQREQLQVRERWQKRKMGFRIGEYPIASGSTLPTSSTENDDAGASCVLDPTTAPGTCGRREQVAALSPTRQEEHLKSGFLRRQLQPDRGIRPGQYMRGIAAEAARAWNARTSIGGNAITGAGSMGPTKGDVDPVALLLPEAGQRVGGPAGRGPLLRRLQGNIQGMSDDFVVVTITQPGQLFVRLRPDPRGLVVLNNFDLVPDDPQTSCPRLGPIENVGTVTPGDAVVSVNREILLGRPFQDCIRLLREASAGATVAEPCVMCFRKADPDSLGANDRGILPRNLEQEKRLSLERVLNGGDGGILDEVKLRGITSEGVPDAGGLRPVIWRFLLRCLPLHRDKWAEILEEQRAQYARFVQELITKPAESVTQSGSVGSPAGESASNTSSGEHMLISPGETSGASKDSIGESTTIPKSNAERGESLNHKSIDNCMQRPLAVGENGVGKGSGHMEGAEVLCERSASLTGVAETGSFGGSGEDNRDGVVPKVPPSNPVVPAGGNRGVKQHGLRPTDDDPLSNKESSGWAALWSDKELMNAIEQDVVRTMPDLAFYAGGGSSGDEEDDDSDSDSGADGDNGDVGADADDDDSDAVSRGKKARVEKRRLGRQRHLAIARILFVHAKLNPAESYTQGMNEIVATLFFVLASDGSEEWSRHAEADTFFCFTNLIAEIRDVFIQSMDDSESGLHGKMQAFSRALELHDPQLAEHMVNLALDPRYFALRWFTTLLCREFDLPDTIRLWDSLFASRDRSAFLVFLFVTLLVEQRETLLAGDFASNLQLLQAYPPSNVPELLKHSKMLQQSTPTVEAMRSSWLADQRAREAAEGAKAAAEQINAAAKKLWNVAADLAAGAAEKMVGMGETGNAFDVTDSADVGVVAFGSQLEDVLMGR